MTAEWFNKRRRQLLRNKREFTDAREATTGRPIKRLSSSVIEQHSMTPLNATETAEAFETDAETGRKLPPMTDVIFVDFE